MAESRTGPKFGHPPFNCNRYLLQLYSKNLTIVFELSQEPCEWVDADLGVRWVESEQILHLKVGCLSFGPVRGSAIYPTHFWMVKCHSIWNSVSKNGAFQKWNEQLVCLTELNLILQLKVVP